MRRMSLSKGVGLNTPSLLLSLASVTLSVLAPQTSNVRILPWEAPDLGSPWGPLSPISGPFQDALAHKQLPGRYLEKIHRGDGTGMEILKKQSQIGRKEGTKTL